MLVGLWSYCDDEGRGLDATALIAATLFPFDLQNDPSETYRRTNAALDELAAAKLVWRCQSRGNAYLQVLDWSDWQRPARPNASRIPSPFGDEPPPSERVCETCGVTLHALRIGAKYCSNACRQRAFRYGNVSLTVTPLQFMSRNSVTDNDDENADQDACYGKNMNIHEDSLQKVESREEKVERRE